MKNKQSLKQRIGEAIKYAFSCTIGRLFRAIGDGWYALSVRIHQKRMQNRPPKPITKRRKKVNEIGFLFLILTLPILNFLIFYVYVNISSLVLAFQKYNASTFKYEWLGFDNFARVFSDLFTNDMIIGMLRNSAIVFAVQILIGFPLNLMFAFVIYKKVPAAGFFQTVLFLPSIISTMVITLMFQYTVQFAFPPILELFGCPPNFNLVNNAKTEFTTQVVYYMWASFGVQLVMYTGAMSGISESIVEAASLDGITPLKEFWFITIPMIWPTITVFLVTTIAGFFTNQMALFNFFGASARPESQTIGYYIFQQVIPSNGGVTNYGEYPYASAFGILFTLVVAPITLGGKYLLEKYGPNAEE